MEIRVLEHAPNRTIPLLQGKNGVKTA